jgi:hypothetical protein
MEHIRLSASPPAVTGFRGVVSRTKVMVEVVSLMKCALRWKHKVSDQAMCRHARFMSLLKVVDRSSTLDMKIPRSIYGWTHHH